MKKLSIGLMALLLAVCLCAGALAEAGVHPYQYGAPEWAKEIAGKGGPKGFSARVKETYGEAKGEKMLESLIPQKGPIEVAPPAGTASNEPTVYDHYRAMLLGNWNQMSDEKKESLRISTFDDYYNCGLEMAQFDFEWNNNGEFSSLEDVLWRNLDQQRFPEDYIG